VTRRGAIGALDRRLTLERAVWTGDGAGGASEAFEPVAQVWAAVETLRGAVAREGGGLNASAAARVTIRWRPDVAPLMRLTGGGETLLIEAVRPVGRRRFLDLSCRTEPAG
jgi:SPP1 family predicted phage head-tail adaptor